MDAKLVACREFTSGGKTYGPGVEVDEKTLDVWPEGALDNRIAGGFVKYVPVPRDEEAEVLVMKEQIETLTAQLAEKDAQIASLEKVGADLMAKTAKKPEEK